MRKGQRLKLTSAGRCLVSAELSGRTVWHIAKKKNTNEALVSYVVRSPWLFIVNVLVHLVELERLSVPPMQSAGRGRTTAMRSENDQSSKQRGCFIVYVAADVLRHELPPVLGWYWPAEQAGIEMHSSHPRTHQPRHAPTCIFL